MIWLVSAIVLIFIDQLSKWLASYLSWPIFLNDNFAFSLPVPTGMMYLIYICILVGISIYIFNTSLRFSRMQKIAWTLVYAGGLSNIAERIVLGSVRDFIPIANGMLNVADFFILTGLMLLLISQRYGHRNFNSETLEKHS